MNSELRKSSAASHGLSLKTLASLLHKSELPESELRALPAQSLYMALRHNGLSSLVTVVDAASLEQCRLLLDLDLWFKDRFCEENIWEWLRIGEQEQDLALLQKILKAIDLKLITLLMMRHVDVRYFEEPSDSPPDTAYYTPDNGYTWVKIKLEDSTKSFLLARFLALIFETDADLFYQLLNLAGTNSEASVEEETFSDKQRRLSAEGIPDLEFAGEINVPLNTARALEALKDQASNIPNQIPRAIEPLVLGRFSLQPLESLIAEIEDHDTLNGELSVLMNAAIVHYGIPYFEQEQVLDLVGSVRGALNIGLQSCLTNSQLPALKLYQSLRLRKLYAVGLNHLHQLRKLAKEVQHKKQAELVATSPLALVLEAASLPFPKLPAFFKSADNFEELSPGVLSSALEPIETLQQLAELTKYLKG